MTRIEILNAFYSTIAELRVARALINDQVRGTNDRKYDLVKGFDRTITEADKALNELRKKEIS